MDLRIKAWLLDIKRSIEEIYSFLPERRDFLEYQQDLKTKKAVERNLEIIGEAVRRILNAEDSFPIINAKRIIGTRNRIIHDYDNISDEIIWAIVTRELPKLEEEIEGLIKE
ncbi:HepT-like ribonuclease domain-containing protein [Tunicatimonas pelagia]|uniref:HepT-like ribonuclease domain-containing protein n=1 Tax=Tunicatimonas pelagia TaxID=931531 RepID=UPI0026671B8B|nr:HepT-like ribonuclease domain-containing protein [Tunicatimonas pelagia]WKN41839.1 DUF86 domain-containing protein [Tunicatimonas pelagia]